MRLIINRIADPGIGAILGLLLAGGKKAGKRGKSCYNFVLGGCSSVG
jgi:hypothetical protein